MNWIKSIFNFVGGVVSKPLEEWQRRKTIKVQNQHELDSIGAQTQLATANARLEMAKNGQQMDFNLDQQSMKNMEGSWKDELVLMVFLMPMVLAFFPTTALHVLVGFKIIEEMPEWFILIIIGMVVVIYGLRGLLSKYLQTRSLLKRPTASSITPPKESH